MPRQISTKKVVLTSFFVDLLDIIVNLAVTLLTGSVVMIAELAQGVSDLLASALLLVGLQRPKRELYFWTFCSTLVMFLFASTLSFIFGLERFLYPHQIEHIFVAYLALGISVVSNGYAFLLSARRIFKKGFSLRHAHQQFRNSNLLMTKNTFVLDLMGMSSAFVGLAALVLYQIFGDLRFDGLGAMSIGLILGVLSFTLALDIKKMPKGKKLGMEL